MYIFIYLVIVHVFLYMHVYVFSSCTILLLQNNGDMSGDVVIVPPPPPSKGEAVDTGDESLAKKKKEKPAWKWNHLKPVEKTPETKKFSIFQVSCILLLVRL